MSSVAVPISATVLDWALEETNVSNSALAEDLGVPASVVDGWRQGKAQPTSSQFHKLAKVLRRPESFFFLPHPPVHADVTGAFRAAPGRTAAEVSPDDAASVRTARRVQRISEWLGLKGYREASRIPGSSYPKDAPDLVAHELGEWLESDSSWERGSSSAAFARSVRVSLEDRGVLVLQLSLGSRGWRGFSLQSTSAPLIAANTYYGYQPRTFTYLHELAHLSTKTENLCVAATHDGLERWCDEVASSMLIPAREASASAALRLAGGSATTVEDVRLIANRFNVSLRASAVRLDSLGLLRSGLYDEVDSVAKVREVRKGSAGTGNPQTAAQVRLQRFGAGYIQPLLRAQTDQVFSRADAQEFLDLSARQLSELHSLAVQAYELVDE